MKQLITILLFVCSLTLIQAQYRDGSTVKYGNEWIDLSKEYFKIEVNQDGLYRITRTELLTAGFPVNTVPLSELSMYRNGEEVYIHTSTNGIMQSTDYIEFYGTKNRNEIDQYFFEDKNDQLNPEFSLITDVAAYFLTYGIGNKPRYAEYKTELSGNLPPKELFYMHKLENIYSASNGYSKAFISDVRYSTSDVGEGFGNGLKNNFNQTYDISNLYTNGSKPFVKARFGSNKVQHIITFKIGNTTLKTVNFTDYQVRNEIFEFEPSLLSASTTLNVKGTHSASDFINLSELSIYYPREFKFNNEIELEFEYAASPFDSYFELQNFNSSNGSAIVYDLSSKRRIESVVENGVTKIISPASLNDYSFKVFSPSALKTVEGIKKSNFVDYSEIEGNYMILTHADLYDDGTGTNWVQKYADYRASAAGGSFEPYIINAEDLYDQFGYGIDEHFLAIKSFLNYSVANNAELDYIFIIGKAREYAQYRFPEDKSKDPVFHVPTFGFPGSDNSLVSKWGSTTTQVPIGRLAAKNPKDVKTYYDKVLEHEQQINNPQTIADKLWMKKILHLSGGDESIQLLIKNYLLGMENVLENNNYGADVTTYYKTSSDPIQVAQSEVLIDIINNGLSMITFFGHSAIGVFDLNLEDVSVYDNKGKYPLMMSLGCHSGNVHTSATGLSQQFVLEPEKGAIAFLAASSQAFISPQNELASAFYNALGNDLYGKSIGEIVKNGLNIFENKNNYLFETLLEQITLHGDPAVKIHAAEGEDYIPDYSTVKLKPEIINAFQDDYNLCFSVANIGKSSPKDISIQIQHISPSGAINVDTSIVVLSPSFVSNYCLDIPLKSDDLVGTNYIKIFVDDKDFIVELPDPAAENNNGLVNNTGGDSYEFNILNNGAVPVTPKKYAIYNQSDVTLMASSFNALGDKQNFIFQIDTVNTFDSPFKIQEILANSTGLLSWKPSITFTPNRVYYWRVSPENISTTNPGLVWQSSSFIYLPNSNPGWNQSHHDQFEDNEFDELQLKDGKLEYVLDYRDIRVVNRVRDGENFPNFFIGPIFIAFSYAWYLEKPLIGITAFDSLGNFRWNTVDGAYGSQNVESFATFTFYYDPTSQQSRIDMVNFLEDQLEKGDFVFFYTVHPGNVNADFKSSEWAADSLLNNGRNIFNILEAQGSNKITDFRTQNIVPYNYFYQKDVKYLSEGKADDINGTADNKAQVYGRWYKGTETSVKIGPSTKWRKFVWKDDPSTVTVNDSSYMRIYGVTMAGNDSLLMDKVMEKEINLAQIDAQVFPFLKLEYFTHDQIDKTSPNLDFWRVFYDGKAELAFDILDPEAIFFLDTIDQGDELKLKIPLRNIGMVDVDSISIRLRLTDQSNQSKVFMQKLAPIAAGSKEYVIFDIETQDLSGIYSISIEANGDKNPEECFYFNNFGLRNFVVRKDLRNPILDVSFDGRRILNRDIVSAEPIIHIVTKDENKFLLMNDTSSYRISIIDPNGVETKLDLSDPNVTFIPASTIENNQSEITYAAKFETDGIYTLKVASSDMSGNKSGNQLYTIEFEIINEELVSNVLNYPNPFSDCTQFVFTLTGNEMPDEIGIRIMTVSGKVVKEISGSELGPLQIGVNRTEYKWNGTDEFGSKLANGVYLYQIVTKKQSGEVYEKYDNGTDQFFKNSIGKMVIIR